MPPVVLLAATVLVVGVALTLLGSDGRLAGPSRLPVAVRAVITVVVSAVVGTVMVGAVGGALGYVWGLL